MRRIALVVFAAALFLGGSREASAQTYSNICWNISGNTYRVSLTVAGSASGQTIFDVSGFGTGTNVPLAGTLIYPPAGDVRFSLAILAASAGQNAVQHQMTLNRVTFNGTGSFRWYDGSASGNTVATLIGCPAAASNAEDQGADRKAAGLPD